MNGTQQFFFFLGGWKRQRTQQKLKGNKRIQTGSKQTDHLNFVFPCSNFHSILCTHWATKRKNIGFMSCQPSLWLLYYWFYYIKLSYSHHQQPLPRKSQISPTPKPTIFALSIKLKLQLPLQSFWHSIMSVICIYLFSTQNFLEVHTFICVIGMAITNSPPPLVTNS